MKTTGKHSLLNHSRALALALIIAIYMSGRATAQGMPVYDNTNFISMTKSFWNRPNRPRNY